MSQLTKIDPIEELILVIRGKQVLIDSDLARLYGVETRVLNQAVNRNIDRFPENFMFQLTKDEAQSLRSQIVTLQTGSHFRYMPKAFTEHGVLMVAYVLKSDHAIKTSIQVIESFIKLRQSAMSYAELAKKIKEHDLKLDIIFKAIDRLVKPLSQKEKIVKVVGFKKEDKSE